MGHPAKRRAPAPGCPGDSGRTAFLQQIYQGCGGAGKDRNVAPGLGKGPMGSEKCGPRGREDLWTPESSRPLAPATAMMGWQYSY